ncbi:hypothetical protein CAK78_12405 [Aeromonas sp. A35_P]|nr:hypothetical protein CAK78_12405 [Aeromonas sp. A35_P]
MQPGSVRVQGARRAGDPVAGQYRPDPALLSTMHRGAVPPRVEYSLSPLGIALTPLLQQMHDFALSHGDLLALSEAEAARTEPHLGEPS